MTGLAADIAAAHAPRSFTFTIPGCPVPWERVTPKAAGGRTLTPNRTRKYEADVRLRAMGAGVRLTGAPVRVTIACHFPNKQRRDLDNIAKAILDGLQGPMLLSGDHWEAVPSLTITGALDAANPRAVVTIDEIGPAPATIGAKD